MFIYMGVLQKTEYCIKDNDCKCLYMTLSLRKDEKYSVKIKWDLQCVVYPCWLSLQITLHISSLIM